ncbi:zf-DHHC-domain-containing protein [Terfezia boudieri ATCC MYA-4762]|uniref:Palmitoyltransferase PFA4 n=1 Tax=Terfezia boudieri ATCC MYA-4762 TaxID=1051890 RepID=A0A3N4MCE5_9PEZI|nr:zf-DHHC-domain-containing protein [Terfezia boudieri ATCC MYA-4762]
MAITVTPLISRLLVVFVCILISSLAYPTQYVFLHPYNRLYAPWWTGWHTLWFNFCVLSIWISYARSVGTDPGGLPGGKDEVGLWVPDGADELGNGDKREEDVGRMKTGKFWGKGVGRWCKKCEAWKPPRCHHCRKCGRCVLRMDHHCPWTNNCVGYQNLPHFLRFLCYATYTTLYLEYHLVKICLELWDLPSSYSPQITTLTYLIITILVNTLTAFSLTLLTLRTLHSTAEGTTTIEEWEKARHASLVRRKVVKRVVFPWDIGIWENLIEAMGGGKWWVWWWVGAKTRKVWKKRTGKRGKNVSGSVRWEVNGFEDPSTPWPPHDPERQPAAFNSRALPSVKPVTALDDKEYVAAFRERQKEDLKRWGKNRREEEEDMYNENREDEVLGKKLEPKDRSGWDGTWRNEDGATLADFGVDEDAEGGMEADASRAYEAVAMREYPSAAPPDGYARVKDRGNEKGKANSNANAGWGTGYDDDDEEVSLAELMRRRRHAERTPDAFDTAASLNVFSG